MKSTTRFRIPLLLASFVILFSGVWAGLMRMNWQIGLFKPSILISHGYLMIPGFLGTLIGLERAVALQKKWGYLGPLSSAIGAILIINQHDNQIGFLLILIGSAIMTLMFFVILKIHFINYTITMALGGISLLVGNLLWGFGLSIYQFITWWMGFLILSIAGERLELGRLMKLNKNVKRLFVITITIFFLGAIVSLINISIGQKIASSGMILLAIWLFQNDIARKTIRQDGLPKFIAISLLSGYVWLFIGGLIGLTNVVLFAGPVYDAYLHSIFLGFVMSMIFAHAPIILPSIINTSEIIFKPILYLPLVLLHLSLVVRILGDIILDNQQIRQWGGMLNAITIFLYFGITIAYRLKSFKTKKI